MDLSHGTGRFAVMVRHGLIGGAQVNLTWAQVTQRHGAQPCGLGTGNIARIRASSPSASCLAGWIRAYRVQNPPK